MFINEQVFDPAGFSDVFWDTAIKEDLDHWWVMGVEGMDYIKFYSCL